MDEEVKELLKAMAASKEPALKAADDKGAITVATLIKIIGGVFSFLVVAVPSITWIVSTMSTITEHNVTTDNRIKTVEEKVRDLSVIPANDTRQDQKISDVEKSVTRIENAQTEIVSAVRSQDSMLRNISNEIGKLSQK